MTVKNKHKSLYLDTNVLLNNPKVLFDFNDSKVEKICISQVTIQELDKIKNESGTKGKNARDVIKEIIDITDNDFYINKTQRLVITETFDDEYVRTLFETSSINNDDRIIAFLDQFNQNNDNVLFLTLDNIAYIKAKTFIKKRNLSKFADAELFDVTKTSKEISEQYKGQTNVYASCDDMSDFNQNEKLSVEKLFVFDEKTGENKYLTNTDLTVNEFIIINSPEQKSSLLGYFDGTCIRKLKYTKTHPYGVTPKNVGQIFFQEALMRDVDEAPLVICKGPAGTAKTFYSVAVGLEKVINTDKNNREYNKILCCRPNVQMDEDIGFLPGDEQDKIAPYFRPIIDNLEALTSDDNNHSVADLITFGNMQFEAVAFMRGRSIVNTYLIVDEAQNLTITQVKGIITRAGKGTKVILVGDPEQIDNPFLDKYNNGLSYASSKMKGSKLCWQISMDTSEGVRSKIATEAAKLL